MHESNEQLYFLNQLYRDFILPDILGKDTGDILYWAGKHVANHYDLASLKDLQDFFQMGEFGHLELAKQTKTAYWFNLTGQVVIDRLASNSHEFNLESGIIAACVQAECHKNTESSAQILEKQNAVQIIAQFD